MPQGLVSQGVDDRRRPTPTIADRPAIFKKSLLFIVICYTPFALEMPTSTRRALRRCRFR